MKPTKYLLPLITIIITGIIGCSSGKDASNKSDKPDASDLNIGLERIPPGVVRIRGTIVDIDTSRKSSVDNSPCGKQPCWAKVRIDSILGYGAGAPVVSRYETVSVNFVFTLGPTTKELFPNLDNRLPGLPTGSSFQADLRILSDKIINNKQSIKEYRISSYEKF